MNGSSSLENIDDIDKQNLMVFEDKEYHSNILDNLNMLRKNKQFCDVILQVSTCPILPFLMSTHKLTERFHQFIVRRPTVGHSNDWIVCMTDLFPSQSSVKE